MNKFLRTILFASFAMSASFVAAQGKYPMVGEPKSDRDYKRLSDDFLNGRYNVSPDEAAPLLEKYPQSPYVWRLSSNLLLRAGRFKEALNAFQMAFERLSKGDLQLERSLVYCKFRSLVGLGLYADARAVLDEAIGKFPSDGYLYSARAVVNECLGYNLQAEDDYGSAIFFSPDKEDNYAYKANLMIRRGKDERVAEFMRKNGGSAKLTELESRFRLGRGEIPEAVSCFFFAARNGRVDPLAADRLEQTAPGYYKWALAANMRNGRGDLWLLNLKDFQLVRKGRPRLSILLRPAWPTARWHAAPLSGVSLANSQASSTFGVSASSTPSATWRRRLTLSS